MTLDESRIARVVERVVRRLEAEAGGAAPAVHAAAPVVASPSPSRSSAVFETPDAAVQAARRAFLELAETSLETRDRMIAAIRCTVEAHAPELARLAVEETGLGRIDDKVRKNLLVGRKTPGTEDLVLGFANTHGHLGRLPERFADSAGLRDWLSQQQQVDPTVLVVTGADVVEAREIRDALVTVMISHASKAIAVPAAPKPFSRIRAGISGAARASVDPTRLGATRSWPRPSG